ncbi:MAG: glycosyltransferase family 61 protein [Candidatus Babeliales bacterium]|jgi:hypothetical protein
MMKNIIAKLTNTCTRTGSPDYSYAKATAHKQARVSVDVSVEALAKSEGKRGGGSVPLVAISAVLSLLSLSNIQATTIKQVSISEFVAQYPQTNLVACTDKVPFKINPFPLYQDVAQKYFPSEGYFLETSVLEIPNGKAYLDGGGYVFVNNCFIKETEIKGLNYFSGQEFEIPHVSTNMRVSGRVAVISHLYPYCYGHFIFDVLGQLALLELNNIEYDYLCVPYGNKFMQEALQLWGIDQSKIIPLCPKLCLQASTIIMATSVTQTDKLVYGANYNLDFILRHVSQKLLAGVGNTVLNNAQHYGQKIFISRKDAGGKRAIPNEDEIFALFEPLGFKRYELTSLSLAQQIALFHNATTIVSFVGSGSTNVMFCKPGTHYVEIIQSLVDATFFYVADMFDLQYSYINNSTLQDLERGGPWAKPSEMPLNLIQDFLNENPNL